MDGSDPPAAETTPLIQAHEPPTRIRPSRTVTFDTDPVPTASRPFPRRSQHARPSNAAGSSYPTFSTGAVNPTVLAALNNRLRRRNSGGSMSTALPAASFPKMGPQRSSKTAQKLKLLPEPDIDEEADEEEDADHIREREVYSQFARIKDPTARRDAARLGKADRERLPRVTAYCTANRYSQELLLRFFKGRGKKRGANPKLIDECIYSPDRYVPDEGEDSGVGLESEPDRPRRERRHSADLGAITRGHEPTEPEPEPEPEAVRDDSLDEFTPAATAAAAATPAGERRRRGNSPDFDTHVHTPEVFAFDYGVVVVWGMTVAEEKRFLKEISRFEIEPLAPELIETEEFNFYYTREYQPRIYNDFITLRDKHSYMTKLAISHALAQSVKVSFILSHPAPS